MAGGLMVRQQEHADILSRGAGDPPILRSIRARGSVAVQDLSYRPPAVHCHTILGIGVRSLNDRRQSLSLRFAERLELELWKFAIPGG
jgi:hypothetical protein